MDTHRSIADTHGFDRGALRDAVQWLVETAGGGRGAIVFHRSAQARALEGVLPEDVMSELVERGTVGLKDGPRLELYDAHSLLGTVYEHPILAIWTDAALLGTIDVLRPSHIHVVPWAEADVAPWRRGWSLDPSG